MNIKINFSYHMYFKYLNYYFLNIIQVFKANLKGGSPLPFQLYEDIVDIKLI